MTDQKTIDQLQRFMGENLLNDGEFVVGIINGKSFMATLHAAENQRRKGKQRFVMPSGVVVEITPPESNENHR